MTLPETILCVYCNAPWTKDMIDVYSGSYGCDTGWSTIQITVECDNCGKRIYSKNDLGNLKSEEVEEIRDEVFKELKESYDPS